MTFVRTRPPTVDNPYLQPIKSGWESVDLGQNIYWIYPKVPITASGAAVTANLNLQFPFKLISIIVEHCVAAGTLGTDALTWSFNIAPRAGLRNNFPIVSHSLSAISQFLEVFGDDYVYPAGTYRFIQNTTNTDLIYVTFVIQKRETR